MDNINWAELAGQWGWVLFGAVVSALLGVLVRGVGRGLKPAPLSPLARGILEDLDASPVEPNDSEDTTLTDHTVVNVSNRWPHVGVRATFATETTPVRGLLTAREWSAVRAAAKRRIRLARAASRDRLHRQALAALTPKLSAANPPAVDQTWVRIDRSSHTGFFDHLDRPVSFDVATASYKVAPPSRRF